MKIIKLFLTLFIIIFLTNNLNSKLFENFKYPIASKGEINFENFNFEKFGSAKLNGEWEFYWNCLIEPGNFSNYSNQKKYFYVPSIWNNYKIEQNFLPGYGFATYRLLIKGVTNKVYGIKIYEINCAYKLYINGKLIEETGKFSTNKKYIIPSWERKEIFIENNSNLIELVFQVANFNHRKGGIEDSIYFGYEKNILKQKINNTFTESISCGIFLIMMLYHFYLYFRRKSELGFLNFAFLNFLFIIRILFTGEKLFINFFPNFNWEIAVKIEYLSYYMIIPLFINYFYDMFKYKFPKIIKILVHIISGIFINIVIFTPVKIFSNILIFHHIYALLLCIYIIYKLFILTIKSYYNALILLLSFTFLMLAAVNDILYNNGIIRTGLFFPYGFLVFIIAQSYLISLKLINALEVNEDLVNKLEEKNVELKKWYELMSEQSEEKITMLLSAIEQAGESIVITDINGNIEYVNKKFTEVSGYSFDEVKGKNPRILKSGYQPPEVYENLWKTISNGNIWRGEFLNKKKNGELYWEEATIAPIKNKKGEIINYYAVKQDITEKKKIEEELKLKNKLLEDRNYEIENQLDLARNIQKNLLPSKCVWSNVAFYYYPMDKIGGDFFDFINFRNYNQLGIFLSDVSGHGIPAALITAMIKSLLLQAGSNRDTPSLLMKFLNETVIAQSFNLFTTAYYSIINIQNRKITICNAGHNYPFLIRNNEVSYLKNNIKSPPLAIFSNDELISLGKIYQDEIFNLEIGDKIIFYTDGLIDIIPYNEINSISFGENKLKEILKQYSNLNPQNLVEKIKEEMLLHRKINSFEDDICIICVEIK